MGKIKVDNMDTFRDTATILALYDSYATSEPFVKCQYGIRCVTACVTLDLLLLTMGLPVCRK